MPDTLDLRFTPERGKCCLWNLESPDWRSRLAWSSVKALHRFASIWILGHAHYPYPVFVPPAALPYPARLFVERKVKEAGGRVR